MKNNNQVLIDGLRMAADFLESKPDFPDMGTIYGTTMPQTIRLWAKDKETLKEAARQLGSFEKEFTDHYFELHKKFNEALTLEVSIDRQLVCKKIVTWDCGDTVESLLKAVEGEGAE